MFGFLKNKSSAMEPVPLVGLVDISNHESNFLKSIQYDLEKFSQVTSVQKPEFMMPLLYAYRISVAGQVLQGLLSHEDFDQVNQWHRDMGMQVASLMSNEEQIVFQEKSLDYAMEFIQSYCSEFTKITGHFFVEAGRKGISLYEALFFALTEEGRDPKECHYICQTFITPRLCMTFVGSGFWDPKNDNTATIMVKIKDLYDNSLKYY
ncbi:hypothetical protein [Psychrobacter sanguinis]|uniref:hypothetical protein n=1 Tax=Psychrobacter sanguinis TaxID=861445 RepID=UPI0028AE933A|nr:hypothetical protein [Psychrobacter sanguinis]